ncbi:MAG: C69 family dipeptidase [Bacteroidales bacterium]|nr:C69 family dipeptidase [Bacteroidales bacterium]
MKLNGLYFKAFVIILLLAVSNNLFACYAIIVGKKASTDGSVLVAHAELNDNLSNPVFLNFRVVPRMINKEGTNINLENGGIYPAVKESYSFIWSENFGMRGSDAAVNEWGVACFSDGTPTKLRPISKDEFVKNGEIVDGGIDFSIRIEVAKRAKTAREGVHVIGELVKRFGSNGTVTFIVADANEAWIVSLIKGKKWVAQRVPDDEVVVLANVNIIQGVNFNDTLNFLGTPDIVDYAIKKGFYDPKKDNTFNFTKAFDQPLWIDWFEPKYNCDARQWRGQCLVTGNNISLPVVGYLPFSVKPKEKLSVQILRKIMSDHLEGTEFDKTNGYKLGSPHDVMKQTDGILCDQGNQEVAICQLRNWLPREAGCIYWRSNAAICSGVLVPWYIGITSVPRCYYIDYDINENIKPSFHLNPPSTTYKYDATKAFWIFNELENLTDMNYKKNIVKVQDVWGKFEVTVFANQETIEKNAVELLKKDNKLGKEYLTNYSNGVALQAIETAKKMIDDLKVEYFGY